MTDELDQPLGTNDQLMLICGISGSGKSASLLNIRNQEKWMYLNTEAGKRLPFKHSFDDYRISDPYEVHDGFEYAIENPDVGGIILDSATFLMDMFETQYVIGSSNTMQGWANYQQFWKKLMQDLVVRFARPVIITAHVRDDLDEKSMEMKTAVPIKGALRNNGIEAYFSTVVATKKLSLKDLKDYSNHLLNITEEDELVGYKHVFQTRITKTTTGERIRSPMGLFKVNETYTDNDAQLLLDHLNEFYN